MLPLTPPGSDLLMPDMPAESQVNHPAAPACIILFSAFEVVTQMQQCKSQLLENSCIPHVAMSHVTSLSPAYNC